MKLKSNIDPGIQQLISGRTKNWEVPRKEGLPAPRHNITNCHNCQTVFWGKQKSVKASREEAKSRLYTKDQELNGIRPNSHWKPEDNGATLSKF